MNTTIKFGIKPNCKKNQTIASLERLKKVTALIILDVMFYVLPNFLTFD